MKMLKREIYLSRIRGFYNSDLVKILVGIRRCGKSVILKQIITEFYHLLLTYVTKKISVEIEYFVYTLYICKQ